MPSMLTRATLSGVLLLGLTFPLQAESVSLPQLLASHQDDAARALINEQSSDGPYLALQLAQLEGMIRVREGEIDAAITIFRKILSADPNFDPARLELAKALLQIGDADSAYYHFELLQKGSRDPKLRHYAGQQIRAIKANQPYGFSVSAALLPSSNFNRGSGQNSVGAFEIDEDSKAQSGLGLSAGANAHYDFVSTDNDKVTVAISGNLKKYIATAEYDHLSLSPTLTWSHTFDDVTVSLGPTASYIWNGWEPYLLRYGIQGSVSKPLGTQDLVSATFAALKQDYVSLDYRDGYQLSGTLAIKHYFSPAANIVGTVGGTLERTNRDHLDHNDLSVSLTVNQQWQGGLITSLFANYTNQDYLGNYPLIDEPRQDQAVQTGATISHRSINFAGFTPTLTYKYTRQLSNIAFHDYDSHDVSLGLSKNF